MHNQHLYNFLEAHCQCSLLHTTWPVSFAIALHGSEKSPHASLFLRLRLELDSEQKSCRPTGAFPGAYAVWTAALFLRANFWTSPGEAGLKIYHRIDTCDEEELERAQQARRRFFRSEGLCPRWPRTLARMDANVHKIECLQLQGLGWRRGAPSVVRQAERQDRI